MLSLKPVGLDGISSMLESGGDETDIDAVIDKIPKQTVRNLLDIPKDVVKTYGAAIGNRLWESTYDSISYLDDRNTQHAIEGSNPYSSDRTEPYVANMKSTTFSCSSSNPALFVNKIIAHVTSITVFSATDSNPAHVDISTAEWTGAEKNAVD